MPLNLQSLNSFFQEQLASWEQAASNYKELENVLIKEIDVDGFPFKVQFNPARILSSSAKVDAKSIQERKCFLCKENRPQVQKGIDFVYNKDNLFTVLINPFPIFPKHLTISLLSHRDQLIRGKIGAMLALAKELPQYTLFYNGPKCGASAPDHFHFQAGNRGFLPIEQEISKLEGEDLLNNAHARVWSVNTVFNGLLAVESKKSDIANELFEKILAILPVKEGDVEPMLNILCWYHNGLYTILLYIRRKHRPSHYFALDHSNCLLSPASVDLGGVFITPLQKDFNKLDAALIKEVLGEVCISKEENREIINRIKTVL